MLAAAATAIDGAVVAGVVVEVDAARAVAADTMVVAVAAEDGKASIVASRRQKQSSRAAEMRPLFLYTTSESRTTYDRLSRPTSLALAVQCLPEMWALAHRSDCWGRQTANPEDAMHWLWVILIGLVIGAVAKLLCREEIPAGSS